ncbi:MAG: hypothetical protein ACRC3H_24765 [Lachnospiraceae bacterium]
MMERVYISHAVRTPVGICDGALSGLSEQKLAAIAMNELIKELDLQPEKISEIIIGNSKQTSTPSNLARHAQLEAKLPVDVPAYTVQRQSASGLQAILSGYLAIKSGNGDMILAGGTESTSQIPLEIRNARYKFDKDTEIIFDPIANQLKGAQPVKQYGTLEAEGIADVIKAQHGISDADIEQYLAKCEEHRNAGKAKKVIPIEIKKKKEILEVNQDELCGEVSKVAKPADAAAMCLLGTKAALEKENLPIALEILAIAYEGGSPTGKGYIPVKAIANVLNKAQISINDIDYIEVLEFSVPQVIATREVLADIGLTESEIDERLNIHGGNLVYGLPWGAAGVILVSDLLHRIKESGKKRALVITPAEGGQVLAMIVEEAN